MSDKELMQQALDALIVYDGTNGESKRKRVLAALRERLAPPVQEPSIRWDASAPVLLNGGRITQYLNGDIGVGTPAPRQWQGLTKDDVDGWQLPERPTVFEFAQFVEAKLKEKNG